MSDLVKMPQFAHVNDVVEWQAARIEALEAALKPFADEMEKRAQNPSAYWPDSQAFIGFNFTLGDLRHAASLLNEQGK